MLRVQSDSEHELTDPFTSLCCFGLPLHLFCGALFLHGNQPRSSVGVLGWHRRTFCVLPPVREVFEGRWQCRQIFLFVSFSFFSTPVGQSRVLEHAIAISVDSVVDQEGILDREGKPSRLLDVRVLLLGDQIILHRCRPRSATSVEIE